MTRRGTPAATGVNAPDIGGDCGIRNSTGCPPGSRRGLSRHLRGQNRALDGAVPRTPVRRPRRRCLPAPAPPRDAGSAAGRPALPSCRYRTHGTGAAASRRSGDAGQSTRPGIATACPSSRPTMSCPGRDRVTLMRPAPATDGERWIDDGRTIGAWHEPPRRPACPRHEPEVLSSVRNSIAGKCARWSTRSVVPLPLDSAELD